MADARPGRYKDPLSNNTMDIMQVRDCNGAKLTEGCPVALIKDLKVKGSSVTLKRGTLFKGVHLTDKEEEIECRSDKVKGLVLKTEFVKKV